MLCVDKSVDVEVLERAITSKKSKQKLGKLTSAIIVSQNVT
jgi:tRNA A-37 threonylcarbamoyl transferase component Bud32